MKYVLNFFLLFLMTLDQDVKKEEKKSKPKSEQDRIIEVKYEDLQEQRRPYQKIPDPSLGGRVKSAFRNIGNVAVNAFDNTIGYPIAKYQNYKTKAHFKEDPKSDKKMVYLMHGLFQNEGSQWRLGKQLRKSGYQPYHLKGNHNLPIEEDADKAFEQIDNLHKDTKLKNAGQRKDYFSGHSSGGDVGLYMAGDNRIKQYGIKEVQARAPAPYGIKARTWPQKLLMPLVGGRGDLENKIAKREAVEMVHRDPKINVHVVAGRYDRLVPPRDAVYMQKHPRIKHYIIPHKDSTHFGTSGVNEGMNNIFIDLINEGKAKYKKYYKRAE